MRVALITTYPPLACGIGNYAAELVRALGAAAPEVDVQVLAERVPEPPARPGVRYVWHRRGDWINDLLDAVEIARPDAVHIQHEESFLGQDYRLPRLVRLLAARGLRTAITLHTLNASRGARRFHHQLVAQGAQLIVHQRTAMADELRAQGIPEHAITVIPHGTPTLDLPARDAARAELELPRDATIALFFGFIHFRKRVHVAAEAFVKAAVPNAKLVIVGKLRTSSPIDGPYNAYFHRKLRPGIANGSIIFRPGFVDDRLKASYMAAADLLVLPHHQPYGSASGVLHEALAAQRAVVCTHGNKFAELVERVHPVVPEACPPGGDVPAWRASLAKLLVDETARARVVEIARALGAETSWEASGAKHAALYRQLAGAKSSSAVA